MLSSKIPKLKCFISQSCDLHLAQIKYVLDEISVRLGARLEPSFSMDDGPFLLSYGEFLDKDHVINIKYDSRCYISKHNFKSIGDPPLWAHEEVLESKNVDLIGGIFRLLSLADEFHISEEIRDKRGIFSTTDLPVPRQKVSQVPIIENHIQAILKLINEKESKFVGLNRWPQNKKWVVLTTHDTDAVSISCKSEIIFNFVKGFTRNTSRFKMFLDGLSFRNKPIESNPLYGFTNWINYEEKLDIKSAFYLLLRKGFSNDISDWRSSVKDLRFNWDKLKCIVDNGWEIGYHPPICAQKDIDEFIYGKSFIENNLNRPIYGLRHHYWALDWRNPYLTYRKHVNAGFRYDLSISWKDSPGFRSGTCLPYRPWDPGRKRGLDIYVVPTSIMDGHIIPMRDGDTFTIENCANKATNIILDVIRADGVLLLDWHTESSCNSYFYKGHIDVLSTLYEKILGNSDVWVTTPWELIHHWHKRRYSILYE